MSPPRNHINQAAVQSGATNSLDEVKAKKVHDMDGE